MYSLSPASLQILQRRLEKTGQPQQAEFDFLTLYPLESRLELHDRQWSKNEKKKNGFDFNKKYLHREVGNTHT